MDSKHFIKLKSKKIVMSVLLFLSSIFFMNMDVKADYYVNNLKVSGTTWTLSVGADGNDSFENAYVEKCKNGNTIKTINSYGGTYKNTGEKRTYAQLKIDVNQWPEGNWDCTVYIDKGKNYTKKSVLFWKSFGKCSEITEVPKDKQATYFKSSDQGSCYYDYEDKKWKLVDYNQACSYYTYSRYGGLQDDVCNKTSSCNYKLLDGDYVCTSKNSANYSRCSDISSSYKPEKEKAYIQSSNEGSCYYDYEDGKWKLVSYDQACTYYTYSRFGSVQDDICNKQSSGACKYQDTNKECAKISGNSSGSNGGSTGTTTDDPSIMFDANGGYSKTYNCPTNTVSLGNGICLGSVKSGTTVNFPPNANYKELFKYNVGAFMGWATSTSCMYGKIDKTSTSVKVTSDKNLYACYTETFNDDRYLLSGAISGYNCGTKIHITYCKKNADGSELCYYDSIADQSASGSVDRMKLANKSSACGTTSSSTTTTTTTTTDKGWRWINDNGDNYSCGDQLYITTCTTSECNYTKIKTSGGVEITDNGTVTRDLLDDNADNSKKECNTLEVDDGAKECGTPEKKTKQTGTNSYTVCYDKDKDTASDIKVLIKDNYKCDTSNGYYLDETNLKPTTGVADCNKNNICTEKYTVTCTKGDAAKPTMEVSSGIANSDGKGTIAVKASIKEGTIDSYFVSENYLAPTGGEKEWQKTTSNTFTITGFAGTKYIWVQDSEGNISNAVSGTVIDTVNTKNTLGKLELKDANGNIQTPSRTTAYGDNTSKSNKYVRLSSDLSKDSEVLADGFNPFDMEYKLEVSSPTVSVYATLTSTDAKYVEGYEPRTVNLNYGVNTILIKIEDNEGKIRTYTILVTRIDDRTSDNTLNDLTLSVGEINFNSNVTDYKVEIPTSTTSVDVNSTIASDKASYVSGYEPGNVEITGDTTVKLIKVQSQTGSTRTYVITFVKEGTDVISKESLQLSDLVIPGVYMAFEEDVANYSLSVDYETDSIDITPVLKDENSEVLISSKNKNESDYILRSGIGTALEVGENFIEIKVTDSDGEESYYRITIIRKEFGLEISNDTTLKDLKVMGYDIDFDPNDKEYTVKIKQEKTLVITAVPNSNRAEVFIRGNDELTGFSTVRVKVVAENGEYETYSIDIKKDAFNKTIEIASIIAGAVIILVSSGIIIVKKKAKAKKEYFEE